MIMYYDEDNEPAWKQLDFVALVDVADAPMKGWAACPLF